MHIVHCPELNEALKITARGNEVHRMPYQQGLEGGNYGGQWYCQHEGATPAFYGAPTITIETEEAFEHFTASLEKDTQRGYTLDRDKREFRGDLTEAEFWALKSPWVLEGIDLRQTVHA